MLSAQQIMRVSRGLPLNLNPEFDWCAKKRKASRNASFNKQCVHLMTQTKIIMIFQGNNKFLPGL